MKPNNTPSTVQAQPATTARESSVFETPPPAALKDAKSVTGGTDSRYIWQNRKPYHLRIYNREIQVIPNVPPRAGDKPPRRKEGDIKSFSKSSRLRVMRKMNRVQAQLLGTPIFVTCTHRHGTMSSEKFQYAFLKKFAPKLKEIVPEIAMMWRLEPHRNGKPHYHCIIWSYRKKLTLGSEFYGRKIRQAWRDAIDQHDRSAQLYSCKIEELGSHKKAMQYISKYVAKEDDHRGAEIEGRRWGTSTSLPVGAITEVNLARAHYEKLKNIVRTILKAKSKPEGLIESIVDSDKMMWVWLDPDEIEAVLEFLGLPPPINHYKTYRETGLRDPDMEHLEALTNDYGYDF